MLYTTNIKIRLSSVVADKKEYPMPEWRRYPSIFGHRKRLIKMALYLQPYIDLTEELGEPDACERIDGALQNTDTSAQPSRSGW